MSDSPTALRALFAVAGSALALGAAASPALADSFDGRHMSVNQGAACALHDVDGVGRHVVRTGTLPKVFDHEAAGPGRTDGVKTLCNAVRPERPGAQPAQGLLGGLPAGG